MYHYILTADVIQMQMKNVNAKIVLIVLTSYSDADCQCFPSIQTIADRSSLSVSSAKRALRLLESDNLIIKNLKRGQSTRYQIRMETIMERLDNKLITKDNTEGGVSVTPEDKSKVISLPIINKRSKETGNLITTSGVNLSFENFWAAYPRRIGKGHARRAYAKALKLEEASVIISAAIEFSNIVSGSDIKYVPHPTTWLNGERWDDDMTVIVEQTNTNRINDILSWDEDTDLFPRLAISDES